MFLDANIFIHAYRDSGPKGRASNSLMGRISKGEQRACTSVLVLNEVLHFFCVNYSAEQGLRVVRSIRSHHGLEVFSLDSSILDIMPDFVNMGLDASDAFHAAAMRAHGVDVICTYDKGFERAKLKRFEPK